MRWSELSAVSALLLFSFGYNQRRKQRFFLTQAQHWKQIISFVWDSEGSHERMRMSASEGVFLSVFGNNETWVSKQEVYFGNIVGSRIMFQLF